MKPLNQTKSEAYFMAQSAMAQLKASVRMILEAAEPAGLRNADIGRTLGIYTGHVEHEGHIPRTLLAIMEAEGVVKQDSDSKLWTLTNHK